MKRLAFQLIGIDPHDALYDLDYFEREVEHSACRSASTIAKSIQADLNPQTVMDVGCGTGALLEVLRKQGCEVAGLEYAESALNYCRERKLEVQKFDLERMSLTDQRVYDLAISMEVAEHLPEVCADRYVALLTGLSSWIVFTAARIGQGGTDHVNEQPASYWIAKFRRQDFAWDKALSDRWAMEWECSGSVEPHYYRNLLIFRRQEAL